VPEIIQPDDLIPMDLFVPHEPLEIDLVYAIPQHQENIFKTALYHKNARLFLHRDLARIVIAVSRSLHESHQWILVLKDGLRTIEAEHAAMATDIIKENPQWLEGPNVLFSKPGTGAHPRGMAIDVSVVHENGTGVDMGTAFDEMSAQSARDDKNLPSDVLQNRQHLEDAFIEEAAKLNLPMLPLPAEWWDFRFPRAYYEQWAPLSDADLPEDFRMCTAPTKHTGEWQERFDKSAKEVLNSL
jgi:D-alanyl-D-alanine dipeptidase